MRTPVEESDRAKRRDLNLYWWGQTTSAFGSVFTGIAMPVIAVVYLDASPGQISVISAASILPMLLLGLPAGAFADRIARPRRTLLALDTLSALTVATVAMGVASHVASIGWLVALGAVQGCMSIVLEVVYFIHLRQLTDTASLGRARARLQAGQYGAGIVGRLLAGPAIVVLGPAVALSVDAVSYVLSAAALLSMAPVAPRPRNSPREPVTAIGGTLRSAGAGLRIFVGDTFLRALLVCLFVPGAATAGVATLTAPFLLRVVKVPTEAYGLLFLGSGLMGLAGSILAGRLLRPGRDPRQITLAAFTASLVLGLLLPLATGPLPVAALCAALGISLPAFFGAIANVALGPVIVSDVAEEATGRTVAMLQVLGAASGLVGALAGGVLGDWIGVRPAMLVLEAGALVALLLSLPPAVRAARQLRETSAPAPAEFVETADREGATL
jgi:MFS family permease